MAGKTQDLVERRGAPLATPTDLRKVATKDIAAAMNAILGPDREKLLSGDAVEDARGLARFANNFERYAGLEKVDESKDTLIVGDDHWPLPIPIVKRDGKWQFDTHAGMEEILNRRIGENELAAILTCRAFSIGARQTCQTTARTRKFDAGAGCVGLAVDPIGCRGGQGTS